MKEEENEVVVTDDKFRVTLREPLIDGEKKLDELVLDLYGLKAADIIKAEGDLSRIISAQEVAMMVVKPTNLPYQLAIAAKASGLPIEVMMELNGKDSMRIGVTVQNFLLG